LDIPHDVEYLLWQQPARGTDSGADLLASPAKVLGKSSTVMGPAAFSAPTTWERLMGWNFRAAVKKARH
jgi:hypothetical protein